MDNSPKDLLLGGREAVIAASQPSDWRAGAAPDYDMSRKSLAKERTAPLADGSLESIVETVVQVFELEVSHKHDPATWVSVVADQFKTRLNGGAWYDSAALASRGSYNVLIGENH